MPRMTRGGQTTQGAVKQAAPSPAGGSGAAGGDGKGAR